MARRVISLTLVAILGLVAVSSTRAMQRSHAPTAGLQSVMLGMGYVPSIQFAPFYVADQLGYYRQAGLRVTFSYGTSPNLLQLTGAGRYDFAIADGTDVIAAGSQGIPVTSVATLYRRLPVAVFALQRLHLRKVADLRGKSIGVPGRFGSTYAGLLAALRSAGLGVSSVSIRTIGFTQAENVVKGTVQAAVGYSTNEPVLLQRHGYKISTIEVGSVTDLVGPGIAANRSLIRRNPALVRRFVQATMKGLALTVTHPARALAAARTVHGLSTLKGKDLQDQYAVLQRAIAFWHDSATRSHGLGYADLAQWNRSIRTLRAVGQLSKPASAAELVTNRFAAGAPRD